MRDGSATADAADLETDPAQRVGVEQVAGVDHDAALGRLGQPIPVQQPELGPFGEHHEGGGTGGDLERESVTCRSSVKPGTAV